MSAPCKIDVKVGEDHEIFLSPSDFATGVTRDALRSFRSIQIEVPGNALSARVDWTWRRHWSSPFGRENYDAEVVLKVTGRDEAAAKKAFATISSAITRGGRRKPGPLVALSILAAWGILGALTAALVSGLYLLKAPANVILWVAVGGGFVSVLGGTVFGTWLYPSIEVAPAGQTHIWRVLKSLGPIALTLILAGITKLLFK